ncbi:MAG: ABC transporter substrate-binding protein [Caldilineaceae bacterium]|nr:ABC transporter substrate-binding protein [Caldilineaceae bacterium]
MIGKSPKAARFSLVLTSLLIVSLLLAACGGAAGPAETGSEAASVSNASDSGSTAAVSASGLKEVPRNRTHIFMGGGREGQFVDHELWNPYAIGSNHQIGPNIIYEPLAFYSAFADEELLWLAESYEYNDDFTELTIKTRQGINWSDGEPFTAEDVAYTLDTLREIGSAVRWGVDVQQFVEEVELVDENTVVVHLNVPAPRFFYFMTYKYDIGVYIVPKHIFEGQDWTTFTAFDLDKGWPVTTGPFTVVASSPEQKIFDRRDSWWAADQGLAPMPQMERVIRLPAPPEQQAIQAFITNEIDTGFTMQPTSFTTIFAENDAITTHSGREAPYGYLDWWPVSMYVNNEKEPYNDARVRWALSYFIDRQQVVDIGWSGANTISRIPMPPYPPLMRYFDKIEPIFAEYNTSEFNPDKGTALLEEAGFTKDGDGNWMKPDGTPFVIDAMFPQFLSGMALVVVEQLKNQGIDVRPSSPPDYLDRFSSGDYEVQFFGHGGSVRDPYYTLRLYQSSSKAVPGDHQVNFSKWSNPEYDAIVDQVFVTPMDDYETLENLFYDAMNIWLPELPDIPLTELYHRIGHNNTYWTNWPEGDDAYVNGASWHLTHLMVLWNLEAVEE